MTCNVCVIIAIRTLIIIIVIIMRVAVTIRRKFSFPLTLPPVQKTTHNCIHVSVLLLLLLLKGSSEKLNCCKLAYLTACQLEAV